MMTHGTQAYSRKVVGRNCGHNMQHGRNLTLLQKKLKEILNNETGYNGTYTNSHILQYIIWDQKYKFRDKEITRKDPRKCKGM